MTSAVKQQFICANWSPGHALCKKSGGFSCKNCSLVVYCGPDCQKSHWPLHKVDCKSPLGKEGWRPSWDLENRKPAFVKEERGLPFGQGKTYLWGNMPALDILQLELNEGKDYGETLRLLFAASGDLRNVVKTIAQLPGSYHQPLEVTMNDKDPDIVARNAIMLLIAFVVDNVEDAIDCIIHLWYSKLIRKSDLDILQQLVRPLIEGVCEKTKGKAPSIVLAKTWKFGPSGLITTEVPQEANQVTRTLRLVLPRSSWDRLLLAVDIPKGLTAERAHKIRADVVLVESRRDYRDRYLLFQTSSSRIAKSKFWSDGLLLPLGFPRSEFQEPNPTFFQNADTWPMKDNADPVNGWSIKEVEETFSGLATADMTGKLFYYIRTLLRTFLHRISSIDVSFRLFELNVSELPKQLEPNSFSRIEVSNITDDAYLGLPRVLVLLMPLLQKPLVNPHATLIALFMNAVDHNVTDQDKKANMTLHTQRILKYLQFKGTPLSSFFDPRMTKICVALDAVATYDNVFDRYMKKFPFLELAKFAGATMKEEHTIIEKWPFKLKLQPGQAGAQEEFDRLMGGGVTGKERYVEWKRV